MGSQTLCPSPSPSPRSWALIQHLTFLAKYTEPLKLNLKLPIKAKVGSCPFVIETLHNHISASKDELSFKLSEKKAPYIGRIRIHPSRNLKKQKLQLSISYTITSSSVAVPAVSGFYDMSAPLCIPVHFQAREISVAINRVHYAGSFSLLFLFEGISSLPRSIMGKRNEFWNASDNCKQLITATLVNPSSFMREAVLRMMVEIRLVPDLFAHYASVFSVGAMWMNNIWHEESSSVVQSSCLLLEVMVGEAKDGKKHSQALFAAFVHFFSSFDCFEQHPPLCQESVTKTFFLLSLIEPMIGSAEYNRLLKQLIKRLNRLCDQFIVSCPSVNSPLFDFETQPTAIDDFFGEALTPLQLSSVFIKSNRFQSSVRNISDNGVLVVDLPSPSHDTCKYFMHVATSFEAYSTSQVGEDSETFAITFDLYLTKGSSKSSSTAIDCFRDLGSNKLDLLSLPALFGHEQPKHLVCQAGPSVILHYECNVLFWSEARCLSSSPALIKAMIASSLDEIESENHTCYKNIGNLVSQPISSTLSIKRSSRSINYFRRLLGLFDSKIDHRRDSLGKFATRSCLDLASLHLLQLISGAHKMTKFDLNQLTFNLLKLGSKETKTMARDFVSSMSTQFLTVQFFRQLSLIWNFESGEFNCLIASNGINALSAFCNRVLSQPPLRIQSFFDLVLRNLLIHPTSRNSPLSGWLFDQLDGWMNKMDSLRACLFLGRSCAACGTCLIANQLFYCLETDQSFCSSCQASIQTIGAVVLNPSAAQTHSLFASASSHITSFSSSHHSLHGQDQRDLNQFFEQTSATCRSQCDLCKLSLKSSTRYARLSSPAPSLLFSEEIKFERVVFCKLCFAKISALSASSIVLSLESKLDEAKLKSLESDLVFLILPPTSRFLDEYSYLDLEDLVFARLLDPSKVAKYSYQSDQQQADFNAIRQVLSPTIDRMDQTTHPLYVMSSLLLLAVEKPSRELFQQLMLRVIKYVSFFSLDTILEMVISTRMFARLLHSILLSSCSSLVSLFLSLLKAIFKQPLHPGKVASFASHCHQLLSVVSSSYQSTNSLSSVFIFYRLLKSVKLQCDRISSFPTEQEQQESVALQQLLRDSVSVVFLSQILEDARANLLHDKRLFVITLKILSLVSDKLLVSATIKKPLLSTFDQFNIYQLGDVFLYERKKQFVHIFLRLLSSDFSIVRRLIRLSVGCYVSHLPSFSAPLINIVTGCLDQLSLSHFLEAKICSLSSLNLIVNTCVNMTRIVHCEVSSETHLIESFLTSIKKILGFVKQNPLAFLSVSPEDTISASVPIVGDGMEKARKELCTQMAHLIKQCRKFSRFYTQITSLITAICFDLSDISLELARVVFRSIVSSSHLLISDPYLALKIFQQHQAIRDELKQDGSVHSRVFSRSIGEIAFDLSPGNSQQSYHDWVLFEKSPSEKVSLESVRGPLQPSERMGGTCIFRFSFTQPISLLGLWIESAESKDSNISVSLLLVSTECQQLEAHFSSLKPFIDFPNVAESILSVVISIKTRPISLQKIAFSGVDAKETALLPHIRVQKEIASSFFSAIIISNNEMLEFLADKREAEGQGFLGFVPSLFNNLETDATNIFHQRLFFELCGQTPWLDYLIDHNVAVNPSFDFVLRGVLSQRPHLLSDKVWQWLARKNLPTFLFLALKRTIDLQKSDTLLLKDTFGDDSSRQDGFLKLQFSDMDANKKVLLLQSLLKKLEPSSDLINLLPSICNFESAISYFIKSGAMKKTLTLRAKDKPKIWPSKAFETGNQLSFSDLGLASFLVMSKFRLFRDWVASDNSFFDAMLPFGHIGKRIGCLQSFYLFQELLSGSAQMIKAVVEYCIFRQKISRKRQIVLAELVALLSAVPNKFSLLICDDLERTVRSQQIFCSIPPSAGRLKPLNSRTGLNQVPISENCVIYATLTSKKEESEKVCFGFSSYPVERFPVGGSIISWKRASLAYEAKITGRLQIDRIVPSVIHHYLVGERSKSRSWIVKKESRIPCFNSETLSGQSEALLPLKYRQLLEHEFPSLYLTETTHFQSTFQLNLPIDHPLLLYLLSLAKGKEEIEKILFSEEQPIENYAIIHLPFREAKRALDQFLQVDSSAADSSQPPFADFAELIHDSAERETFIVCWQLVESTKMLGKRKNESFCFQFFKKQGFELVFNLPQNTSGGLSILSALLSSFNDVFSLTKPKTYLSSRMELKILQIFEKMVQVMLVYGSTPAHHCLIDLALFGFYWAIELMVDGEHKVEESERTKEKAEFLKRIVETSTVDSFCRVLSLDEKCNPAKIQLLIAFLEASFLAHPTLFSKPTRVLQLLKDTLTLLTSCSSFGLEGDKAGCFWGLTRFIKLVVSAKIDYQGIRSSLVSVVEKVLLPFTLGNLKKLQRIKESLERRRQSFSISKELTIICDLLNVPIPLQQQSNYEAPSNDAFAEKESTENFCHSVEISRNANLPKNENGVFQSYKLSLFPPELLCKFVAQEIFKFLIQNPKAAFKVTTYSANPLLLDIANNRTGKFLFLTFDFFLGL